MTDTTTKTLSEQLRELADDRKMIYEVPRKKIEDELIDFRDSGIGSCGPATGLVVRDPNGKSSSVVRMPIEDAVRLALIALADHLEGLDDDDSA